MATTRLIPLHINKGKTIVQTLYDRTSYAQNSKKTDDKEWVSSFACNPETVDAEFLLAKRQYKHITGREQKSDVIAYQYRQSFKPGEITPEEANRVGYEFAERWLKGKYAFIVATHVDKSHIHNHIIWNSTSLDCTRKFRDFKRSGMAARKLSDLICTEHNLSVIQHPKRHGISYNKWLGDKKEPSHRAQLQIDLDTALASAPANYAELLTLMITAGYEVKDGKNPSFRKIGDKGFIRLNSLKRKEYTKYGLIARIRTTMPERQKKQPINLIIDIQAKLNAGKGRGYEQWAKVFNLKQMAKTLNYLQEHQLLQYDDLEEKSAAASQICQQQLQEIKQMEHRLNEIAALQKHITNYSKTRNTYVAYRKAGYSKRFYKEHEAEILLHKAAKKAFDELGIKKLPLYKDLQIEYAALLAKKKKTYSEYRLNKENMRKLLNVKANVDQVLDRQKKQAETTKEHDQR